MLFDARMINASGIGTYIRGILPAICENFDTSLLVSEPLPLNNLNHPAKTKNFTAPIYSIKEQLAYPFFPADDIFFSPHYNVPLLPVRTKKRIVTIHDVYHLAHLSNLTLSQKLYARYTTNMAVRLSDCVITVSEFSKNEIVKYTGCPENKIKVIYNGIKQSANAKADNIRQKYGLPEKYILFVGNVKPHKNLTILLAAYKLLRADMRDEYKIVIVGKKGGFITSDNSLPELINKTQELLLNVIFTGYVADEDMDAIFAAASLFVFPSLYEGFGFPPLEAMLNKCPVIVSDVACLPEVCGDAAVYFDPYNAAELASYITYILNNNALQQKLVENGLQQIKKFPWQTSVDHHLDTIRNYIS